MASLSLEQEPDPTAHHRQIGDYYVDTNPDNMLREGATGKVFPGYHAVTKVKIAAKKMLVLDEKEFIDNVELEISIMMSIPEHQNVIRIYSFEKEHIWYKNKPHVNVWIFMELCEHGDMSDFCETTDLSVDQKLSIMKQCALGLRHLHYCKQRVLHRDIKPQNILLSGSRDSPVAKITDFGVAKFLEYNKEKDKTKTVHTFTGTVTYMAPELFSIPEDGEDPAYKQSVDVFSLGLSFLALLESSVGSCLKPYEVNGVELGRHMWINRSTNYEPGIIRSGDSDKVKAIKAVINSMLKLKPADRCTSPEVVTRISQLMEDGDATGTGREVIVAVEVECANVWIRENENWQVCAQLPKERSTFALYAACFCISGQMLVVIGGFDDYERASSKCYVLSLTTLQWNNLPDIPTARLWAAATALGEDTIIVIGGQNSSFKSIPACETLHTAKKVWQKRANMPKPIFLPMVAVHEGLLYLLPCDEIKEEDRLMEYHPSSDYYTDKSRLPSDVAGCRFASMVSSGSHLYLLEGYLRMAWQYSPHTNQWLQIAAPYNRCGAGNAALVRSNSNIFLCGGSGEGKRDDDLVEEYEQLTQCWKLSDIKLPFSYDYIDKFIGIF